MLHTWNMCLLFLSNMVIFRPSKVYEYTTHSAPFGISLALKDIRSGNGPQYQVMFLNRMHDGIIHIAGLFLKNLELCRKASMLLFLSIFPFVGGPRTGICIPILVLLQ